MGVVNFAHGSFYMVGAYVGLVVGIGWGWLLAALVWCRSWSGCSGARRAHPDPSALRRKEYEPLLLTSA